MSLIFVADMIVEGALEGAPSSGESGSEQFVDYVLPTTPRSV